jgi:hypothetical protein
MSDLLIFILGSVVTALTLTALIVIGNSEAKDLDTVERGRDDVSPPAAR